MSVNGDGAPLVLPDSIVHGVPFDVRIDTFGGSCIPSVVRTDVALVAPDTVAVSPYDHHTAYCGGDALALDLRHTATIAFAKPGAAVIRIVGSRGGVIGGGTPTPVVVERTVVVR